MNMLWLAGMPAPTVGPAGAPQLVLAAHIGGTAGAAPIIVEPIGAFH